MIKSKVNNFKQRIIKDCFWDMNINPEDIDKMANGDNWQQKQFLFEKILLNSNNLLADLKVFDSKDLQVLIEDYIVPSFNSEYAFRRKNIAEVYFLDKPLLIDELKWTS